MFIILLFLFPILASWAVTKSLKTNRARIIRSGAYPNRTNVFHATHFFELQVVNQTITQLLIEIPSHLEVSGDVEVVDRFCKAIASKTFISDRRIKICFVQPIESETVLSVLLQRVRALDRSGRIWQYSLYGAETEATAAWFLGNAYIQTYQSL